nr:hypothetical protein [Tanacetum cinerariifolium]
MHPKDDDDEDPEEDPVDYPADRGDDSDDEEESLEDDEDEEDDEMDKQMAPRRTTRSTADQETVNATTVTNPQLQTMIDQGVTAALAACDALRSTNGDDSHNSITGVRRMERAARECTYTDFLKLASKPKTMQEAIEIVTKLMDKKVRTFAERETSSKRKFENTSRTTRNQQ